jgi:DNA-binding MarR family transcriptional regulator
MADPSELEPRGDGVSAARSTGLFYLLKHAQLRLAELNTSVLAPFGISGRELAVLTVIGEAPPLSQQELARRMAIDRTTTVALIDGLESKSLVTRRPDPQDRRRNVVGLTDVGRVVLRDGRRAADEAEQRLLAAVSDQDARHLRRILRNIVSAPPDGRGNPAEGTDQGAPAR